MTTHEAHDGDDLPFVGPVRKLATISSHNVRWCRNNNKTQVRGGAFTTPRWRLPPVRSLQQSDVYVPRSYPANGPVCFSALQPYNLTCSCIIILKYHAIVLYYKIHMGIKCGKNYWRIWKMTWSEFSQHSVRSFQNLESLWLLYLSEL